MVRLSKDEALQELERERDLSQAFGGCVMCRLACPSNAHHWLADNEHGVVVLDGYGSTLGHLLVISKPHIERTTELEPRAFLALQGLVWEANQALERELQPERVYVATLGSSKQLAMSFPHFHSHVVPVYETDERARPAHVFSWSSGVERYRPDDFARLEDRLRGAWPGNVKAANPSSTSARQTQSS